MNVVQYSNQILQFLQVSNSICNRPFIDYELDRWTLQSHLVDKGSKSSDIVSHGRLAIAHTFHLLQLFQGCKPQQLCTYIDCGMVNPEVHQ